MPWPSSSVAACSWPASVPSKLRTTVVTPAACAGAACSRGAPSATTVATATAVDNNRLMFILRPRRSIQLTPESHGASTREPPIDALGDENDPHDPLVTGRLETRRGRRRGVERTGRGSRPRLAAGRRRYPLRQPRE